MFLHDPLATALSTDRQARFRRAATRRRLVSRNKAPSADTPSARILALDWSAETDLLLSQPRAHCVA
ncbi:MAG: hypothetical protein ACXV5U_04905 [Ilumatobacteraceae bacterium]